MPRERSWPREDHPDFVQEEIRHYVEKWEPILHRVKKKQYDDWHWLALAIDVSLRAGAERAPLVVTNDLARDHRHHFSTRPSGLQLEQLSAEYRDLHFVRFLFSYHSAKRPETLERGLPFELFLYEPRPYVQRAQRFGAYWVCPTLVNAPPDPAGAADASSACGTVWGRVALPEPWRPFRAMPAPAPRAAADRNPSGYRPPALPTDALWLVAPLPDGATEP